MLKISFLKKDNNLILICTGGQENIKMEELFEKLLDLIFKTIVGLLAITGLFASISLFIFIARDLIQNLVLFFIEK